MGLAAVLSCSNGSNLLKLLAVECLGHYDELYVLGTVECLGQCALSVWVWGAAFSRLLG